MRILFGSIRLRPQMGGPGAGAHGNAIESGQLIEDRSRADVAAMNYVVATPDKRPRLGSQKAVRV